MPGTSEGQMGRTDVVSILALVACLNICPDGLEFCPQHLLGRGEQHLVLYLGTFGGPDRTREREKEKKRRVGVCC